MSKPKPSFKQPDRAVDDWVHQSTVESEVRKPVESKGKIARLTIDLPPDLHARFKSACALNHTKMMDEVRRFIEEWTQKHS